MRETFIRPVELKLKRAKFQAEQLLEQIREWTASDPIKFKTELRDERLGYKLIISEIRNEGNIEDWGVLFGEYLHNLRSSLENLAFALARIKLDPPEKPIEISFPIFRDEAHFIKTKIKTKLQQNLPRSAADLIEGMQPFQRNNPNVEGSPNSDPLAWLQWFNNMDKHQIPSIVIVAPRQINKKVAAVEFYSAEDAMQNGEPQVEFFGYPLKVASALMEFKSLKPIAKVSGELDATIAISIETLNGMQPLDFVIKSLYEYIELIINQFRPFFI